MILRCAGCGQSVRALPIRDAATEDIEAEKELIEEDAVSVWTFQSRSQSGSNG